MDEAKNRDDVTEVAVITDSRFDGCHSGGWGPSWSQAEITEIVARFLKQKYNGAVETKFFDLADPQTRKEHPELADQVDANRWNLPLVSIDAKVMFVGYIDHRAIVKHIDAKRASGG